jgi:hypothetical protein
VIPLKVSTTIKWNQNLYMTDVSVDHILQCVLSSSVFKCVLMSCLVGLSEAIICAVFPVSKYVSMSYLVALHEVVMGDVFSVYKCVLMSHLVASH